MTIVVRMMIDPQRYGIDNEGQLVLQAPTPIIEAWLLLPFRLHHLKHKTGSDKLDVVIVFDLCTIR